MTFQDHFSAVAGAYARFRPAYPPALFQALARLTAGRDRAWDCGTGSGQSAAGLAKWFRQVVATDPSEAQLRAWPRAAPAVRRVACTAEAAALADASVDLITVAQALHWFDVDAFYRQARRVGRPGSTLAVWSYSLCRVDAAVDAALDSLHHDALGPFWAPERRHVEAGYRTLPFPFDEEPAPEGLFLERRLTRPELEGYVATWSAVRAARRAGVDVLPRFRETLAGAWPHAHVARRARWPLAVRIGRLESA